MHNSVPPPVDEVCNKLLNAAREFRRVTGMTASVLGRRALNDTNFIFRLEAGGGFTMRSYRRLQQFLEQNWPRDAVPADDRETHHGDTTINNE